VQTSVAVVSGRGAEGGRLALRFAHAGLRVRVGSRNFEEAQDAARRIAGRPNLTEVTGQITVPLEIAIGGREGGCAAAPLSSGPASGAVS